MTLLDKPILQASRRSRMLLLAVAILWGIYWFLHTWPYWEDDAFIHLEFARSVAAGQGFSFNGHLVSGDTAPLWVLLLAAMHLFVSDWLVAGKLLTVLGTLLGFAGIYAFARRLTANDPAAALFPAAMVLLIAANPYVCYWAFSGMEPLAAAGVAFFATLAASARRASPTNVLTGCLLAGLAPLLRPEMIFLSGILALLLIVQWKRMLAAPLAKTAAFCLGLLLLAGPLIAWSVYSHHAFGRFIPNTNAAKRAALTDSVPRHLLDIYTLGFPVIVCGVLAGLAFFILRPSGVRRSLRKALASWRHPDEGAAPLPLAGWVFVLWPVITTVFYIVNHTYVQTRYILVTAPGLTIDALLLAYAVSRRTGRTIYMAGMVAALAVSLISARPFLRNKGIDCRVTRDVAWFLRDQVPREAPVAVYSIGELAFYSQHPIIDTGGITRPAAIPYLNQPPAAMLGWARSQGAQYYLTGLQPEPGATIAWAGEGRFLGWTFHPSRYDTTFPVVLWKLAPQ